MAQKQTAGSTQAKFGDEGYYVRNIGWDVM